MVKIMENPIKMDDLGGKNPYIWRDTHIYIYRFFSPTLLSTTGTCSSSQALKAPRAELKACPRWSVPPHSLTSKGPCHLSQMSHSPPQEIASLTKGLLYTVPSLKLTWPLKMDGWNTILSYWVSAYFQGLLLLVSGRVATMIPFFRPYFLGRIVGWWDWITII